MISINEYFSQSEKISSIDEYVSYSETISLIKEYLLGKNKKTTPEDYFVVWPIQEMYDICIKLYKDKMIEGRICYWILSKSEIFNVIEDAPKYYNIKYLRIFRIPDKYKYNLVELEDDLRKRKIRPGSNINEINFDELND